MPKKNGTPIDQDRFIHKEGFMLKRTGMLRLWRSRYFVLLDDLLCYFLREEDRKRLAPAGRIFVNDIEKVERVEKRSHVYSLLVQLKEKTHFMSCKTYEDREEWMKRIWQAKEKQKHQESEDPIRTKSTRLGKDFKRVTIKKDPKHGIGCTIKNVGGAILVSRIVPDGPVATTGVLRPGDQIIDVNGNRVADCSIEQIKEIITSSEDHIICTVKPVTHYTSHNDTSVSTRTKYTEVDPNALRQSCASTELLPQTSTTPYTEVGFHNAASEENLTTSYLSQDHVVNPVTLNELNTSNESLDDGRKKMTSYVELEFGGR